MQLPDHGDKPDLGVAVSHHAGWSFHAALQHALCSPVNWMSGSGANVKSRIRDGESNQDVE